eukprot:361595-Chlamydomonas_euryale.AAC.2
MAPLRSAACCVAHGAALHGTLLLFARSKEVVCIQRTARRTPSTPERLHATGVLVVLASTKVGFAALLELAVFAANAFGLVAGLLLLGYGLVEVPRSLWQTAVPEAALKWCAQEGGGKGEDGGEDGVYFGEGVKLFCSRVACLNMCEIVSHLPTDPFQHMCEIVSHLPTPFNSTATVRDIGSGSPAADRPSLQPLGVQGRSPPQPARQTVTTKMNDRNSQPHPPAKAASQTHPQRT